MTKIRVNPDLLIHDSDLLKGTAKNLETLAKELNHVALETPSYEGQFNIKVIAIGVGARIAGINQSVKIASQSRRLVRHAEAYLAADAAFLLGSSVKMVIQFFAKEILRNQQESVFFGNSILMKISAITGLPLFIIVRIIGYGNLRKPPKEFPLGFIFEKAEDLVRYEKMVRQFEEFENSEIGRQLAADAYAAGLLFVVMDGNKVLAKWGDPNGKQIPISIGRIEDSEGNEIENCLGGYSLDTEEIVINEKYLDEEDIYSDTLPHEMRHAIDHTMFLDKSVLEKTITAEMDVAQIEKIYADCYREVVITEINAHDVGYTQDNDYRRIFLNGEDGVYTKAEIDFIVYSRNYEEFFEDQINMNLKAVFGEDTAYRADVWVDMEGNIRVDIDQSRNAVLKWIDDTMDDARFPV